MITQEEKGGCIRINVKSFTKLQKLNLSLSCYLVPINMPFNNYREYGILQQIVVSKFIVLPDYPQPCTRQKKKKRNSSKNELIYS